MIENYLKKDGKVFIIAFVWSFLVLCICSKNSFLYAFNDWGDINAFFTVGKSMINGLIPYRDLFEQKGPLLYFVYGLTYLISNDTFIGAFILEIISIALSFYFFYKIAVIYTSKKEGILISILLISMICGNKSFSHGGSAEELCLPIFIFGMYTYLHKRIRFKKSVIFVNGILAGCLTLIKINLVAYSFAWISLLFLEFIIEKEYKKAIGSCLVFLFGMAIPIIPFIIYFYLNNALDDFIEVYLIINIKYYGTDSPFIKRIVFVILNTGYRMLFPISILIINLFGVFYLLIKKCEKNIYKIIFVVYSCGLTMLAIYWGGKQYVYYYIPLFTYSIFGIIYISSLLKKINKKITIMFVYAFIVFSIGSSDNIQYINKPEEYYTQYIFKELIEQYDDRSIFNFNLLDAGMYTVLNNIPNVRYFEGQNISYYKYPVISNTQSEYIKKGLTKFIITEEKNKELVEAFNNYRLLAKNTQLYEGEDRTLVLYERIDEN